LIFQALALTPETITNVLLANLKQFGSGRRHGTTKASAFEVWLFPSFGKGSGFGEPDVLLISEHDVFWIEVETTIDCQRAAAGLRSALLQLRRFHLFQCALAQGPKVHGDAKRIVGTTIGNDHKARLATVKLAGHGVLKELASRLTRLGVERRDHYVLFTVDKPRGPGKASSYKEALQSAARQLNDAEKDLPSLPIARCWYAYWNGDIKPKFENQSGALLSFDSHYVRIKRRARTKRSPRG